MCRVDLLKNKSFLFLSLLCLLAGVRQTVAIERDSDQDILFRIGRVLAEDLFQSKCSNRCHEENCDLPIIKYGKYCGVTNSGCPGEDPCDSVDKCCKIHDYCVGMKSITDVVCHKAFINCLRKEREKGTQGFSRKCPYSTIIPTMENYMLLAIALSSLGNI